MGLVLIPSEVTGKTKEVESVLTTIVDKYQNVLQVVQNFSATSELDADAWNALKIKVLDYHQIISQGVIAAEDSILADAASLSQSVGTEELYEDRLREIIEKLENDIEEKEEKIEELEELRDNFIIGLFSEACRWIDRTIFSLRNEIAQINQVLMVCRQKLQFLYMVESSTQGLFDSSIQLLVAVEAAINDAGVEITGKGEMSDGNWKLTLEDANAQMDKKIEAFIEDAMKSELQIDLKQLEEMYGEDVVNRLKGIMTENGISRLEEGSEQKFVEATLSQMFESSVKKVDGKYEYADRNGVKVHVTPDVIKQKLELYSYINTAMETADWYETNITTYCHMTRAEIDQAGGPSTKGGRKYYTCNLPGNLNGVNVGDDCSSFVWAVLVQNGYFDKDTERFSSIGYLPGGAAQDEMEAAGFVWYPMTEIDGEDLRRGDILVKNGHVEIFYAYEEKSGYELALSWGNVPLKGLPTRKGETIENIDKEYEGIWRLEQ